MRIFLFAFLVGLSPLLVHAELHLAEPKDLLAKASFDKNQLRDVINDIDQSLADMRDAPTFDKYFFMLDDLQVLADRLNLETIYPEAVKKLGGRMVQKGVNWLDLIHDSKDKILYYHRWMIEPQPAFAFLYSVEMQIKEEPNYLLLKKGAENLEAALLYADQKWPHENALRLLYRNTASDMAVKILKTSDLPETEVLFWLGKIYTPEAMIEITIDLQNRVYALTEDHKTDIHSLLKRLSTISRHISTGSFAAPENLTSQIGDTIVDLLMKSFRFQEKISDDEYDSALAMMQKRHYSSLANSWTTIEKAPSGDFAYYFIQRAFKFIIALKKVGLPTEAELLSRVITQKSAALLSYHYQLEGLWEMTDSKGRKWHLNIIFANENYLFADISQEGGLSMPLFSVAYDINIGGFIATRRGVDPDSAPNIPIRFFPNEDGTLRVVQPFPVDADPEMTAKKVQSYPNLFTQAQEPAPDLNGIYEGNLTLDRGGSQKVRLVVTVINSDVIANLQHPSYVATFNYGNDATGGVLYLTRGNDTPLGFWMHLRAKLDDKGNLNGYVIMGDRGMMPTPFHLKKVRSIE